MAYTKQEFADGQVLSAKQLNKMDDQIALNAARLNEKIPGEGWSANMYLRTDANGKVFAGAAPESDNSTSNDNTVSLQVILRNIMTILKAQVEDDKGTPQAYDKDISGLTAQNDTLIAGLGNPDDDDGADKTLTGISVTYSGGAVAVGTAVADLTGIVVTAHYADSSTKIVTGYTLTGEIAEGNNIITVTYAGRTATFSVTGITETGTTSIRYMLPSETTFDGTNYIDTGVTLIDEDRDFTLCMDYTPTAKIGYPFDISHNNTGGLRLLTRGGYFWDLWLAPAYVNIGHNLENMRIAVTHEKGASELIVAWVTESTEMQTHVLSYTQNTNLTDSKNIILGADYTKASNFAEGTMHRFAVYNGVLSDTAINDFLGVSA